jgi:hypothetical protein
MTERFGSSQTEDELKKIMACRDIVKEILNFGVSQKQILMIIQFLGYELENHEQMTEVVALTKEFLKGENGLLINQTEDNDGTPGK